jgi:DNA-binding transcriptional regulator LsrR (DeoR family)
MWKKCTLLVCGVGIRGSGNLLQEEKLITEADLQELDEAEAVGDLFGRWFDANGREIACSCNRRLISVFPHLLQEIPRRILVASGEEKVRSIRVLLEKSMMNILISDEQTAKKLLQTY